MAEDKVDFDEIDEKVKAAVAGEEEQEQEEQEQEEQKLTEQEQKAVAMGWNPDKESVEEDGKEWVPAEEFLRNQKWVDEINRLKRENKRTQKMVEALKEHSKVVGQKAYDQAIKDLQKKKRDAAEEGDVVRMLEIDEDIDKVREEASKEAKGAQPAYSEADWNTAYEIFVDENSWYTDNPKMRKYADQIGWNFVQENPTVSPEEAYDYVIKEVKDTFEATAAPAAKPKKKAAAVASSNSASAKPSNNKKTLNDIPEEHRKIAMTIIKGGVSEEEYLKQYFREDYS